MSRRLKNSVGIWMFGINPTRFMADGYHPEYVHESSADKTQRALEGLGDLVDGFEYHYPNEIHEDNYLQIKKALGKDKDIYCIALGTFCMPQYAKGGFINPDPRKRKEVINIAKGAIDLAAITKSHVIIWPGGEGYNYPFEVDYQKVWTWFVEGIQQCVEHANKKKVTILLEHKNSEPKMRILMRDIGMTIYTIRKIQSLGTDISRLKVNMDWQHLIMNGENLAEYASLLAMEGLLGHQHANSGWGLTDDDNIVGGSFIEQTLALARALQEVGYGKKGERIGYDLFPYTENQVEAVKDSIIHWEFFDQWAMKLDTKALKEARSRHDALALYREVYKHIGIDEKFIQSLSRKKK
jgi:xylose isomerase